MINFAGLNMRYEPFPIGSISPALAPDLYAECTAAFPDISLFGRIDHVGEKFSLSEKYAPGNYRNLIRSVPVWRRLHDWIKSDDFMLGTLAALRAQEIDLGYSERRVPLARRAVRAVRDLSKGRTVRRSPTLSARFEFSILPAHGGYIEPHTDNLEKIVTIVLSMCVPGEWDARHGGGTEVMRTRDPRVSFDLLNSRTPDWPEMETLFTYPYVPNQALIFVKTFNSWHAVSPMLGPAGSALRKTLTINIEAR